jgi:hypothetical protein
MSAAPRRSCRGPGSARPASGPNRRFRPALEQLEDRRVLAVTYHGGAVLANVGVEALFLGSAWSSDPSLAAQAGQLGTFLQFLTNSSYMDMLGRAGYGIGRGSYLDGRVDPAVLPGVFSDAQVQATLAESITGGLLHAPDADRLYFVFVEPGVNVTTAFGTSAVDFYGYHSAFVGPTGLAVNYAVLPYPTGPNAPYPRLSPFETLTKVSSHELAEGVTDPQGDGVGATAWYDDRWRDPASGMRGGEIADITDGVIVDLGGYVVQGVAGRHDQPLIPAGATFDPRFPPPRFARHRHHPPRQQGAHRHRPPRHGHHPGHLHPGECRHPPAP